jgi:hypothetical protein
MNGPGWAAVLGEATHKDKCNKWVTLLSVVGVVGNFHHIFHGGGEYD